MIVGAFRPTASSHTGPQNGESFSFGTLRHRRQSVFGFECVWLVVDDGVEFGALLEFTAVIAESAQLRPQYGCFLAPSTNLRRL